MKSIKSYLTNVPKHNLLNDYHNLTKFQSETGYYKKMDETYFYNLGINWIMKNKQYLHVYLYSEMPQRYLNYLNLRSFFAYI